jgi:hypothetical protein
MLELYLYFPIFVNDSANNSNTRISLISPGLIIFDTTMRQMNAAHIFNVTRIQNPY